MNICVECGTEEAMKNSDKCVDCAYEAAWGDDSWITDDIWAGWKAQEAAEYEKQTREQEAIYFGLRIA